jgi:hypothetical protein
MKTLSVSLFFLMVSGFFGNLSAQSQATSSSPTSDADRAIVQSWSEVAKQPQEARIEGGRLILPVDHRNAVCAFLRVYRVKRETPDSDATRPAGYTTCVSTSRFTTKNSTKPQSERRPTENVQSK